jgi:hypothetical protein
MRLPSELLFDIATVSALGQKAPTQQENPLWTSGSSHAGSRSQYRIGTATLAAQNHFALIRVVP